VRQVPQVPLSQELGASYPFARKGLENCGANRNFNHLTGTGQSNGERLVVEPFLFGFAERFKMNGR